MIKVVKSNKVGLDTFDVIPHLVLKIYKRKYWMEDLVKMFERGDRYNANSPELDSDAGHGISSLDIAKAVGLAEALLDEPDVEAKLDFYENLLDDFEEDPEAPEMLSLKHSKVKIPAFEQYVINKCKKR